MDGKGGDFTEGGAVLYDSRILAAISNSIVVTINYRLGALGNLVTSNLMQEDPILNWGLQGDTTSFHSFQSRELVFIDNCCHRI